MKKILLLTISLIYSNFLFSQQDRIVKLQNEVFKNSFVYSIETKTKSNFIVYITSIKDKQKVIIKNHEKIIGKKFFKIDVSGLKTGIYSFKIVDNKLKVIFKKKIKKI
tara:strand:+ start:91 stop:414 length:324 start_codon:yes stop_codon:yes gene_type:complete